MDRYETMYVAKHPFLLSMLCWVVVLTVASADVFEVDTVKPYSEDYMVCIEEAKAELRAKARPELKEYLEDISEYDNILV